MDNCKHCEEITDMFNVIGKTYYRMDDKDDVLCYRHWHQANRPEFLDAGEYYDIFSRHSINKVNTILTQRKEGIIILNKGNEESKIDKRFRVSVKHRIKRS